MGSIVNGIARARRLRQAVRLDVPDLQRLHAPGGAALGADGAAGRLGRGRTTRSGSARTARRTSPSRRTRRCARSRTSGSCGRPTRTRPPCAWKVALERDRRPGRARRSRGRRCRRSTAPTSRRRRARARRLHALGVDGSSPDLILIATGAEVGARARGRAEARRATAPRCASSRCRAGSSSRQQPADYRDEVLPPEVKARLSVEPGVALGWKQWVGDRRRLDLDRALRRVGARRRPCSSSSATTSTTSSRARCAAGRAWPDASLPSLEASAASLRDRVRRRTRRVVPTARCRVHSTSIAREGRGRVRPPRRASARACSRRSSTHEVIDLGTDTDAVRIDYPGQGARARRGDPATGEPSAASSSAARASARRSPPASCTGIRAAICHDVYRAHQGVEHDDMNVLCLGSEVDRAVARARARRRRSCSATFDGGERYVARLAEGRTRWKGR